MGELVIQLKQHTPMLHFQHEQYGATLRSTEVKPKLDRFIKEKVGLEKLKSCFIGDSTALNYKMKIEVIGLKEKGVNGECEEYWVCSYLNTKKLEGIFKKPKIIPQSPYFAQEEINREIVFSNRNRFGKDFSSRKWQQIDKKGLLWRNDISIRFFSLNQTVLKYVYEYIEDFFICTNFGTRSNKGFGCFTVCKKGDEVVNLNNNKLELVLKENFDFVYQKKDLYDIQDVFFNITKDYRLIKSGSSLGRYKKSGFFSYAEQQRYRWDKPYIKSVLLPKLEEEGKCLYVRNKAYAKPKVNVFNSKFVRPLLGLAGNYMFQVAEKGQSDENIGQKVYVFVKNDEIQRFASPLLFKVINRRIYLVGKKDDIKPIKDKSFSLEYNETSIGKLSTPADFDLEDFLDYVFKGDYPHKNELNYSKLEKDGSTK